MAKGNFDHQYPKNYVLHLFQFLENDYLDDKLRFCQKYEIQIFHFIDTLTTADLY